MKKILYAIIIVGLIGFLGYNLKVQKYSKSKQQYAKWFTSKQIADKVWVISDHGADNFYLVEGDDSALLIDNGLGAVNVRDYVAMLTKLPVIVVNTHGHADHAGADYQFPIIYAHPADFNRIEQLSIPINRKTAQVIMLKGAQITDDILFTDTINLKPFLLKPITQGYVFDLGNRKLEVIEVPGHTAGSICLLDKQNKQLFTGDDNNSLVWLFLEECEPLEVYLQSLIKLNTRNKEFNTLFPGHGEPIDKTFIVEEISCVQNILNGSCKSEAYKTFVGDALLCTFKRSGVAYNSNNLRVKQ
jgi:hydroxyacylglutathione hydrolase